MEKYIGIIAGICTCISLVPQLLKILKEKKANDISFFMLFILITGLCGWIWYGVLKKDYPIICTNVFAVIINGLMIVFSIKYKNGKTGTHSRL
ncbi:SemiSWEET family sugar transporter [Pinibacter aurantiacus]|uniref:SemiSWEET transporter n=1 Tax=Pinibacter aurantiacus TaxID=2851599 RepID=A0A9E2SBZ6_9BACT|nr:SemiSWEET transporter [Pinibacter aurantiacus]MBV4358704.1 SemiSWEET transporter [Pinibacter aurantiacus]